MFRPPCAVRRPPCAVHVISQKPFSEFLCNLVWGYLGPIPGGFFLVFLIESFKGLPGPPKCPLGANFAHFAKFLKNCSVTFSIILHEHAPGYSKYSCEICIRLNHSKGLWGPPKYLPKSSPMLSEWENFMSQKSLIFALLCVSGPQKHFSKKLFS